MKRLLVLVALILLALGAWWYLRAPVSPATSLARYESDAYGFSFSYPASLEAHPYTPEIIAVGTSTTNGFDTAVEVRILESAGEGGYENFAEFVFEHGRNLCAADGPTGSIECTRVIERVPFTTDTGVNGDAVSFELVARDFRAGSSATSTFGPVYAFNIAPNVPRSAFAALLVYQPLASVEAAAQPALVRAVAASIRIDALE